MSNIDANADRVLDLTEAVCDENASHNDLAELDAILLADQRSRRHYLDYYRMHVSLRLQLRAYRAAQKVQQHINSKSVLPVSVDCVETVETPSAKPFGFLATPLHGTIGYLSSGWPVAYLAATVICGVSMLIGSAVHVSEPAQVARQSSEPSRAVAEPKTDLVGRITGMVDCKWAGDASDSPGVPLGRKYELTSGLMEITYDTGTRVILQGPATYEVESGNGGYLAVGKMTGKVENDTAKGFTVRTPTASITDLGTQFGVEVSRSGETTSHVFRGSIRVQVAAAAGVTQNTAQVLHEGQSASVGRGGGEPAMIVASPTSLAMFIREIPKRTIKTFDLVDVVAGGDGFSGRRGRGIDPTDGRPTDTTRKDMNLKDYGPIAGDGKYHRVQALPLVDGVFIPNGRSGAVQVDSAGHTFGDFGKTDGMTGLNIWAGGTIPVPSSSMPSSVSSLLDSLSPSTTLGRTKLGGIDYAAPGRGLIFLHANNGITFDLEAIRRANPDRNPVRFRATAGNVEPVSQTGGLAGLADLWVLVDGQVRFRRREINGCSGAFPILFPVAENDRFLTLAATDGGKATGMAGDWVLFGNPLLEMATSKQKGE